METVSPRRARGQCHCHSHRVISPCVSLAKGCCQVTGAGGRGRGGGREGQALADGEDT